MLADERAAAESLPQQIAVREREPERRHMVAERIVGGDRACHRFGILRRHPLIDMLAPIAERPAVERAVLHRGEIIRHEIGAELAKLPPHQAPTRRDWSRLSATWTARIEERIAELERLKLGLTECIGCGCLSLDRCQLANPGDRAARFGPGPRYWIGDRPAN